MLCYLSCLYDIALNSMSTGSCIVAHRLVKSTAPYNEMAEAEWRVIHLKTTSIKDNKSA